MPRLVRLPNDELCRLVDAALPAVPGLTPAERRRLRGLCQAADDLARLPRGKSMLRPAVATWLRHLAATTPPPAIPPALLPRACPITSDARPAGSEPAATPAGPDASENPTDLADPFQNAPD